MNKTIGYLPQAFITRGKQRIKQIENSVYLNDGDKYEIELFNPTKKSVLAKIQLDGDYISAGGVVIRPGERIYLERFLDTNNRFVFNTYEVEKDNSDVKQAIQNNGKVRIEFYNESTPYWFGGITYTSGNTLFNTSGNSFTYTPSGNSTITLTNYNLPNNLFTTTTTMETGRTEKGEESNQSFVNSNQKFEYFPMNTIEWKILPNSQKLYTQKDIKRYCGDCGAKIKKSSYKFCPHCGSELD